MTRSPKNPDPRPTRGGSAFELRLSSAVACGLSAFVLQTALFERVPCAPPPDEESPALSLPDAEHARSSAVPGQRRGHPLFGASPFSPGPGAFAEAQPEPRARAVPPALRVSEADAPRIVAVLLAGHPLRGPPRLPS